MNSVFYTSMIYKSRHALNSEHQLIVEFLAASRAGFLMKHNTWLVAACHWQSREREIAGEKWIGGVDMALHTPPTID